MDRKRVAGIGNCGEVLFHRIDQRHRRVKSLHTDRFRSGLLNVAGFYDPLIQLLDHMRDEQFLTPAHRVMLTVESDSEALLDRLSATKHTLIPKPIHQTTNLRQAP